MKTNNRKNNIYNLLIKLIIILLLLVLYEFFKIYNYNLKELKYKNKIIISNIKIFFNKNLNKYNNLKLIFKFIKICKSLKRINNKNKKKNEFPFLSICIPLYNSEKYIEKSILSIINQSFQDYEIIIINDFSIDNSLIKLLKLKNEFNNIKIINHPKNLGIYNSRVEAALNSKGKYILYLDPDDMIINPFLFEILYYYYLNYNLDIIEFTVYYQNEKHNKLYYPKSHELNHYHNFSKNIIYQPELSNILYYKPRTKKYSSIICRCIWNKLFKKDILLKSINYIGNDYYKNHYIIFAEDTLLNIINFHFSNNYTNINILGYLYNIRRSSISRIKEKKHFLIKKSISFFLFYQIFYKIIKEYDKDRNYLYYDLKPFGDYLLNLKKYNVKYYLRKAKEMFVELLNDNKISIKFRKYIKLYYKPLIE